jgi:hypothetical protein
MGHSAIDGAIVAGRGKIRLFHNERGEQGSVLTQSCLDISHCSTEAVRMKICVVVLR